LKVVKFKAIKDVIKGQGLIEKTAKTGDYMRRALSKGKFDVKGYGTTYAIKVEGEQGGKRLKEHLQKEGVLIGKMGPSVVVAKPALIFEEKHADMLANAL